MTNYYISDFLRCFPSSKSAINAEERNNSWARGLSFHYIPYRYSRGRFYRWKNSDVRRARPVIAKKPRRGDRRIRPSEFPALPGSEITSSQSPSWCPPPVPAPTVEVSSEPILASVASSSELVKNVSEKRRKRREAKAAKEAKAKANPGNRKREGRKMKVPRPPRKAAVLLPDSMPQNGSNCLCCLGCCSCCPFKEPGPCFQHLPTKQSRRGMTRDVT